MEITTGILLLEDGIIEGDVVRELQGTFPELQDSFRQRKSYDEYYYDETNVRIDIQDVKGLIHNNYSVEFSGDYITIKY